jgi:CBS domain-containing protein
MRVFEVMRANVRTVTPETSTGDALELMRRAGVHHLVVTRGPRIVGVVSAGDLDPKARAGVAVDDVMTAPVVTVDRNETVRKVANLMDGRTIGCLPVTADGALVGIVTTSDLLRLVGKGVARPEPKRRRVDHHRVPHRKAHVATGKW